MDSLGWQFATVALPTKDIYMSETHVSLPPPPVKKEHLFL